MKKIIFLFIAISIYFSNVIGQQKICFSRDSLTIISAVFDTTTSYTVNNDSLFYSILAIDSANQFQLIFETEITPTIYCQKYQQYYLNIPVEDARVSLRYKNGNLFKFQGYYLPISQFDTSSFITKTDAINIYQDHYQLPLIEEQQYIFEKVIVKNPTPSNFDDIALLVCKILLPNSVSQKILYLDASSGEILYDRSLISGAISLMDTASLYTRNYGLKQTNTCFHQYDNYYSLYDEDRKIILYDRNGQFEIKNSIKDNDNVWTEQEHYPDIDYAQDAYWAAQKTIDYFWENFNWRNYNNDETTRLQIHLNYPNKVDKASWPHFGFCSNVPPGPDEVEVDIITIGSEGDLYHPLVTIDIIAHEFGHAFNCNTSNFHSSDPLNEGASDIWAAIIKAKYAPEYNCWEIGENLPKDTAYDCLRNLAEPWSPKAGTQMISHYSDTFYHNISIYTRSGLFSHWFYILAEGKKGQNRDGYCFDVKGIGTDKGAKIMFAVQSSIALPQYEFVDGIIEEMRQETADAAEALFGAESFEYIQVLEAWDAVGVTISGWDGVAPENMEITANTTWNYGRTVGVDLIINSGVTLTINDTIKLSPNVQIIIQPGGKLIVDGGVLTNACTDQLWGGIRVLGDPDQRQIAQYQGSVLLRNGAVIEGARDAIITGYDENIQDFQDYSGGIIQATDATFRNNLRSLAFYTYTNTYASGTIFDNISHFTNCTFTINNDNFFTPSDTFKCHVSMDRVRGVTFRGCTFENLTTNRSGKAIYTENAGFKLEQSCLPGSATIVPCNICDSYTPNSFSGFDKAIDVQTTGVQHSVIIDHSYFEKNKTSGVSIAGNNYAQIIRSEFNLSTRHVQGAYLTNSSDFLIEENNFYCDDNSAIENPQRTIRSGLQINRSGVSNNLVYRNSFTRLANGITTSSTNGSPRSSTGLEFQCNTFSDNKTDLYIYSGVIKNFQGSLSKGADNHFVRSKNYSINNEGSDFVGYYYSQGTDHEPISISQWVSKINNASTNSCLSTLCNGGPQTKSSIELLADYEDLQANSNQLLSTFQNDGHEHVMEKYYNGEMSWDEISEATIEILNNILVTGNEMREISTYAVQSILNDSILDVDLLKKWYNTIHTDIAKYSLAETHAMLNEFDLADQLLQNIPEMFDFDDEQMVEHDNYIAFHHFKKELHESERTWYDLTEEEIATMQTIAEATYGRSATMAKGVLCFFFDICYPDEELEEAGEMEAGEEEKGGMEAGERKTENGEIGLFPNPTNGKLTIESTGAKIEHIEIYDMMGKLVLSKETNASSENVNITTLQNSIYLVKIYLDNGEMVSGKVVKN